MEELSRLKNFAKRIAKNFPNAKTVQQFKRALEDYFYEHKDIFYEHFRKQDLIRLIYYVWGIKNDIPLDQIDKKYDNLYLIVFFNYEKGNHPMENCEECGGHSYIGCSECNSKGEEECQEYEGEGVVTCSNCDGSGENPDYDEEYDDDKDCPDCSGSGKEQCQWCHGDGTRNCSECNGNGEVSCDECIDGLVENTSKNTYTISSVITDSPNYIAWSSDLYKDKEGSDTEEWDLLDPNDSLFLLDYEDEDGLYFNRDVYSDRFYCYYIKRLEDSDELHRQDKFFISYPNIPRYFGHI